MKRFIASFLFILSVCCGVSHADWTTSRMGLTKPTTGQADTWGRKLNQNFDIIDSSVSLLGTNQTWIEPQTFVSSITVSTMSVYQVRIDTHNFSASDRLAVNGSIKVGGGVGGGIFYACGQDWTKCSYISGGGCIALYHPGSSTAAQICRDGSNDGLIVNTSVLGANFYHPSTAVGTPLRAGRIVSSKNWFLGSVSFEDVLNDENAFEYAVLIGTVTNSSNSKLLSISSSTYSYSLSVGTSATNGQISYHLNVSTMGITSFGGALRYNSKTKTQIQTISNPRPVTGDTYYCSDCTTDAVCVSTGGVNSFVRFSARTTACN